MHYNAISDFFFFLFDCKGVLLTVFPEVMYIFKKSESFFFLIKTVSDKVK